jgi:thymidine phosphorylase
MNLMLAMRDSGAVLAWPDLDGPVLDKHSTGGVGDLVSLILGPIVASCGAYVPMISGRGLGHTGGTLDKLESIPGFHTSPDIERFQQLVRKQRIAIIGQTDELAPADRKIYAVRDVTATVSSIPLIISSILSKKLAEGLDGLVMDIKFGSGAFMKDPAEAQQLAEEITQVACKAGVPCDALITDMNQPLAWSAGNAWELLEASAFRRCEARHERLQSVVLSLSGELLYLGGLAGDAEQGNRMALDALDSGRAAEQFSEMVSGQGGPSDLLQKPGAYFEQAKVIRPVFPDCNGYISRIDTAAVGSVVVSLGGGRHRAEDEIDPLVGLSGISSLGQAVDQDVPLAMVHAIDKDHWERAAHALKSAMQISPDAQNIPPVIHGKVKGNK